jgi:hypothetical protein
MKSLKHVFSLVLLVCGSQASADTGLVITPANLDIIVEERAPRPFIPFTLDDLCKTASGSVCIEKYRLSDQVRFAEKKTVDGVVRESVYFAGTAADYLNYLNSKEETLSRLGYSLRDSADELNFRKIPVDVRELRASLLKALNTFAPQLVDIVREPKLGDECTKIPVEYIDKVPETFAAKYKDQVQKVKEALEGLNGIQDGLCAIGYSLFDTLGQDPGEEPSEFVTKVIDYKEKLIESLGLSPYLDLLNSENIKKIKSFVAISQEIDALVRARKFPGPEQIFDLRKKINAELPPNLKIPDVPSIPVPVPAKPENLNIKKKKAWPGFVFGQRDRVSVESWASMEIAGNETEQSMTASADATLYIFARPINALGGYGFLQVTPQKARTEIRLQALGQDVFEPLVEESLPGPAKEKPELFVFNFDKAYSQQFAIGPVPVNVKAGARAKVSLGYRAGLDVTRLIAAVLPTASAAGYAEGTVGVADVLSAGAGAELTILDLTVPLTGEAGYRFDEVGYPYQSLRINAEAIYEYLNGRIYAYAEYPVPRLGVPPWKIKKDNLDIFAFKGGRVRHKILSWTLDIGRLGSRLGGDLLDQDDKSQSEQINQAILLEQRRQAVAELEAAVNSKGRDIFTGIATDLNSEANIRATVQSDEVAAFEDQFQVNVSNLLDLVASAKI